MLKRKFFIPLMAGLLCWLGMAPAAAQDPDGEVKVGDRLYDVEVHDTEGNYTYLADYVGQDGKYLLVLFWTSNCPRCHAAFPEVAKYAKKYADKLSVVGVMLSDNHDGWMEMYQYKKPFEWPNLSDGQLLKDGAAVPYGIGLFPTFVLVEPKEGKIVKMWRGFKLDGFQSEMQPYFAPVE